MKTCKALIQVIVVLFIAKQQSDAKFSDYVKLCINENVRNLPGV